MIFAGEGEGAGAEEGTGTGTGARARAVEGGEQPVLLGTRRSSRMKGSRRWN